MTTSEPPENRPDSQVAPEHPAPEHPASESPTEQIEPSRAEDPAADPAAEHHTGPGAGEAAAPAAAGTGAFAARPRATRAAGGGRWSPRGWSPRRRWVGIGVLVILVLLLIALICGLSRHHRFGHRHGHGHHGGHGHSAFQHGMPGGAMGMDAMGMGGMGMGGMGGGGFGGPGRAQMGGGPTAGTTSLSGSVVSVAPGTLVVAQDGAGQVTVPTNDNTRMMGAGNGLTGLQPGQRVMVRVGADKSAVAVFSPKAQAMGTITAIAGDRATLVRPDGLTEPVDLSAVNPKPVNGDVVSVNGTATDNGATLKVETLQAMPKTG